MMIQGECGKGGFALKLTVLKRRYQVQKRAFVKHLPRAFLQIFQKNQTKIVIISLADAMNTYVDTAWKR